MISQIFITTLKKEVIAFNDYKRDIPFNCVDEFFNHLSKEKGTSSPVPVWEHNGVWFFISTSDDLHFVAVSREESLNFLILEFMQNLRILIRDFCGEVTEETIRRNQILVYEILTSSINNGCIQLATTEKLKLLIISEPWQSYGMMRRSASLALYLFNESPASLPGSAANKPVITRSPSQYDCAAGHIYLDVIEQISVVFKPDGKVSYYDIEGKVNLKTFLAEQYKIKLNFSDNLKIGIDKEELGLSDTCLEEIKFHEKVEYDQFKDNKVLSAYCQQGQLTLMSYHISKSIAPGMPLRLTHKITTNSESRDMDLSLTLKCEIPSNSEMINIKAYIVVPRSTTSFMQQLGSKDQRAEFFPAKREIIWHVGKLKSSYEASANFKFVEGATKKCCLQDVGPVTVSFELSSFVVSGLKVNTLNVQSRDSLQPLLQWIRYATVSDSYLFRLY